MKITNIIAAIIAAITLVADVFFMFVLFTLGEAATALSDVAAGTDVQDISSAFSMVLAGGWIFAILILLTALFCLKLAIIDSRAKKK